jgi:hypothetical protein
VEQGFMVCQRFGSARVFVRAGIGSFLLLSACSSDPAGGGRRGGGGGTFENPISASGSGGASGANAGAGGFGNPTFPTGGSSEPVGGAGGGDPNVCDADVYTGERKRLDIYMMVDDSGSMVPWWPATLEAISMFFNDPGSAGVGVGVHFFGSACDAAYYATPAVAIAPLPDNKPALEMAFPIIPIEGTATLPAMEGAIMHARQWSTSNPDAKTVVLLVTDGLPDDCGSTVENVSTVIAEGFTGAPSIQTFVIGLGDLGALNMFAQSGGTTQALVIEPGAAPALVAALNDIRSAALPCEFALPDNNGGTVQLDRVNLRHTDLAGVEETIGNVPDAASCSDKGGWHYDNPSAATQLIACPASCAQLNGGGEVTVVLGCPTIVVD